MTALSLRERLEHALVAEHVRRGGFDEARKGRLQAIFILAFLALPTIFLVVGAIGGGIDGATMTAMMVEVGVLAGALATLRYRGWLAVSGNTLVATFSTVSVIAVTSTGGLTTSSAMWFLLPPLMALLLVGVRSGLFWLVSVMLGLGVLAWAHAHGHVPPATTDEPTVVLGTTVNVTFCALVAFGCAYLYEHAKNRMLAEVELARAATERALGGTRLVLDHIDEALLVVCRDGTLEPERSAAVDRLFGSIAPGQTLWSALRGDDPRAASWLETSWSELFEDVMPLEVLLDQLPRRMQARGRILHVSYTPLRASAGAVDRILVMGRDVSDVVAAERAQDRARELVAVLSRRSRAEGAFAPMWRELGALAQRVASGSGRADALLRDLHTLKGNAGILDLTVLARLCHEAETHAADQDGVVPSADLEAIGIHFARLEAQVSSLIGQVSEQVVVERAEHEALIARLMRSGADGELVRELRAWSAPRLSPQIAMLAEQVGPLSERLGKGEVTVSVEADDVRMTPAATSLVAVLPHVIRNAVDHGIEMPEERVAAGKPTAGSLRISARQTERELVIEVVDDGRGVDWDALERRAMAAGISAGTDRTMLLFADGVSSRETVTDTSGRGVGLSAVARTIESVGGTIDVASRTGVGTTFRLRVPHGTDGGAREPSSTGRWSIPGRRPPDGEGRHPWREVGTG